MISADALEAVLRTPLDTTTVTQSVATSEAPGTLASHYAPQAPVCIKERLTFEEEITRAQQTRVWPAVLSFREKPTDWPATLWLEMPSEPEAYARHLYAALRTLDETEPNNIIVESVPSSGLWSAIADRIERAAAPRHVPA